MMCSGGAIRITDATILMRNGRRFVSNIFKFRMIKLKMALFVCLAIFAAQSIRVRESLAFSALPFQALPPDTCVEAEIDNFNQQACSCMDENQPVHGLVPTPVKIADCGIDNIRRVDVTCIDGTDPNLRCKDN